MLRYPDRAKLYGPAYVRTLIESFSGLHFDLAVPPPNNIYRPSGVRDSTLYRDGTLDPAWRDLLEAHPDRFLVGSDYRLPIEARYGDNIERARRLILAAVSEPARHAMAYGNAWRLITGISWNG
jgi:predicted TIM-barrel fold metal-dependent hydrolase